jgi:hypothetical protein
VGIVCWSLGCVCVVWFVFCFSLPFLANPALSRLSPPCLPTWPRLSPQDYPLLPCHPVPYPSCPPVPILPPKPHLACPVHDLPIQSCRSQPRRAFPCRAPICLSSRPILACHALSIPNLPCPYLPRPACQSAPAMPCPASTFPASPSSPFLPCLAQITTLRGDPDPLKEGR